MGSGDDVPFTIDEAPHLVGFDGSFSIVDRSTEPPGDAPDRASRQRRLKQAVDRLEDLQRILYADNRHSLLLVFQAMDAAGKDSTIRAVMSGVDPSGCQVYSFKQPSAEELDHDFLWRTAKRLPERGRIGVFNRSYYEEVLVVRVHTDYLKYQRLPGQPDAPTLWQQRYESIRDHELHLARNGTIVLKFWLNVSHEEQRRRFLDRIQEPHKNWKFSVGDVKEREHWEEYMSAYEDALRATSRRWAPWFAIPADSKSYMRMAVAETIVTALTGLGLEYPVVNADVSARFDEMRSLLEADAG